MAKTMIFCQNYINKKNMKNKKLLYGGLIVGAVALAYFLGRKKTPKTVAEQNTPTPYASDGGQTTDSCKNFIQIPCANPPCPKFCLDNFSIFGQK